MLAYTYVEKGKFKLLDKPVPKLSDARDAIVRVTMSSICSSDLHIKHGSVPRAVPGITVGHEMVGIVEETGKDVTGVKPGDRVTVNVETFCGILFFLSKWICKQLYRSKRRLGPGMPDRRRAGRICACSLCGSGIK